MKHLSIITAFVLITATLQAQNVGIGTNTPDVSAKLEIVSDSSGVLVPRMTDAQRDAISNPATGLVVFVTTDSAFYYFEGTAWVVVLHRECLKVIERLDAHNDVGINVTNSEFYWQSFTTERSGKMVRFEWINGLKLAKFFEAVI